LTLKKIYLLTVVSWLLLPVYPGLAVAQLKIGVVNPEKILEQAPQVEGARTRLEKEFAPRDKELVAAQKDVKTLEEKLSRDGEVMSESQRGKLERDVLAKKRELKRSQQEFREDFNLRRNEEFDKLQRQIYQTIVQIAKEKNFDLVLGDGVIYGSDKVDITSEVLQRLKRDTGTAAKGSTPTP
jgi:outer membrane protein